MKTSLLVSLTIVLLCSYAKAKEPSYNTVDTFYVHKNLGDVKVEIQISGAKNGVVSEILDYLDRAGAKAADVQGKLYYSGIRSFYIQTNYFGMNLMILPTDVLSTSLGSAPGSKELGQTHQIRFGGSQAQFLAEQMEKAGVKKQVYPGNAKSFALKGKRIECSYTDGIWGYTCELSLATDPARY